MSFRIRRDFDGVHIRTSIPMVRLMLGSVFLIVGIGVAVAAFNGQLETKPGELPGIVFGVLFGGTFSLIGTLIAFTRSGLRVDTHHRTVTPWWGVLVPMFKTEHRIDSVREVHVSREVRQSSSGNGKRSSKTGYPVRLILENNDRTEISAPGDMVQARVLGEAVAKAGEWPMHHSAAGASIIRQPDQLDWSLRQHLLHESTAPSETTAPVATALSIERDRNGYVVQIPAMGMKSGIMLAGLMLPMAIIPVLFFMRGGSGPPLPFIVLAGAVFGVLILGIVLWMVHRTVLTTELRITPEELTIVRRVPWWKSIRTLRCDDIEELAVTSPSSRLSAIIASGGVTAVMDNRIEEFGRGLESADLNHVADLIRSTVCR